MTLSISDLFTAPTSDQFRAAMVSNLVSLGIPADKWRKGGVASLILTVASMSLNLVAVMVATIVQGFFLPTATGSSLKLLATYLYGVTLPVATYATGNVTLSNLSAASYSIAAGAYQCLNPTTKVVYTNTAPFTLAPSGTASVPVVANVAGSAGNAVPGGINTQVTTLLGVSVTNPTSLAGVDAPSDADIRTLCLNKLGVMSVRGVRTAYAYAIQTAVNSVTGAAVNINRWSVSSASHTGTVQIYVASPSGVPDPNDVTGVATNVELLARPEAVTAIVSPATAVAYSPSLTIWAIPATGQTAAILKTAADAALLSYIDTYRIGGITANDDSNPSTPLTGLFASGIVATLGTALAAIGAQLVSVQGATDLALTASQVATDGITTTVRVIVPSGGTTVV